MLAYSANRPKPAGRSSSPNMMLAIVALHVAALAAVMSARMDMPIVPPKEPLKVDFIKPRPVPPPTPVETERQPASTPDRFLSSPEPLIALPAQPDAIPLPDPLPFPGAATGYPVPLPPQLADTPTPIAATPAVLLTGMAELKPPYPASKLASGEEADLKLRLTIDERGRVSAVEPMGRTDTAFLAAARRHIMSHWRYRPATSGGHGVAATLVITLRFRLDD